MRASRFPVIPASRGLRAGAAVLALAALGACSSMPSMNPMEWFSSGPKGPQPTALTPVANPQAVRTIWQASVGSAGVFVFSPALADESVFAAARDGAVTRLDAGNGRPVWRVSVGTPLSGGVGADGSIVAVGTDKGEVIALDARTGAPKWRARVSSEILSAPRVGSGLVFVRSADSRVFAFDVADGKRRWVYQRAAAALIVRSPAGLSFHQDNLYAGFSGGKLVAIDARSGAVRWEVTVSLPKGSTELERVTDVSGEPVISGREICTAAYQGRAACYELQSGNQIWTRELSTLTGMSVDARYGFVSDDRGSVHALDRSSGRSLWKMDRLAYRNLSLPLPLGNELALGDFQGVVHLLSRDSGAIVGRINTDGSAVRAAPVKIPNGFLVQTANGGLYAIAN
jgi:outer membrane protein assembly factor BamB